MKLEGVSALGEALERVRAHPRHGTWIRGYGWRSAEWDEQPTADALDAVTGDTPALLFSKDYHSAWLNSAALARAEGDLQVDGGVVERDESRRADRNPPRGVRVAVPRAGRDAERGRVRRRDARGSAHRRRAAASSRSTTRTAGSERRASSSGSRRATASRSASGSPSRTNGCPSSRRSSVRSGIGDDYLRIGYLKAFMDGTLGSQTAWMLDGSGVTITSGEELAEIVREGARLGWPVGVHAIGDRANREALDAFETTRDVWQPLGLRHRIEHAQCLAPEDVGRFAVTRHRLLRPVQPRAVGPRPRGAVLAGPSSTVRTRSGRCGTRARSSRTDRDAPVEELDPLAGVRAGVRRTIDDRPAWRPEQCLTIEQTLLATIVNPAWLSGDERRRGKLLPGYLADLVVLSRDPLECPLDELETVEVVATMVGGRWVHNPPPWD